MLLLSTMAMPATSLIIPLYLQMKTFGLLNSQLGLILLYIGSMSPFSIFLMRAFFEVLPNELIEAARIDGASEWGIFFRVMLPLARAGVGTVVILQFLSIWNEFIYANVLLQDPSKQPLQPVIFNLVGQFNTNWPSLHRRAHHGDYPGGPGVRAHAEAIRRRPDPGRGQGLIHASQ